MGWVEQAYELITVVLALRNENYDEMHPESLESKAVLAQCCVKLGLTEEAEVLLQEVAFKREVVLGPTEKYTLRSKAEYADFLFEIKKVEEARKVNSEVIEMRAKTRGQAA